MERTTLGRTGLEVSVAGLGRGGHSRLGLSHGGSEAEAIAVIHRALDLGINLIDTARVYRTEEVVGRALAGLRARRHPLDQGDARRERRAPHRHRAARVGREEPAAVADGPHRPLLRARRSASTTWIIAAACSAPSSPGSVRRGRSVSSPPVRQFPGDTAHHTLVAALESGDDWFDVAMVGLQPAQSVGPRPVACRHAGVRHRRARDVRRAPCAVRSRGLPGGGRRPGRPGGRGPRQRRRWRRSPGSPRPSGRRRLGCRRCLPLRPPRAGLRCGPQWHRAASTTSIRTCARSPHAPLPEVDLDRLRSAVRPPSTRSAPTERAPERCGHVRCAVRRRAGAASPQPMVIGWVQSGRAHASRSRPRGRSPGSA